MNREQVRRAWTRRALLLLAVIACVAVVFGGRARASVASSGTPSPAADTVILTGSYGCTHSTYTLVPPATPYPSPTPDPTAEPIVLRELSHSISISGTGGQTAPPLASAGPGVGPGFGGVGPVVGGAAGRLPTAPINLGSGVGTGFDGGTPEDCARFAAAVAATANGLGCVTSPIQSRPGIPQYGTVVAADSRFSFVCEGPAASQIHAIGELDRAVLAQRPSGAP